MKTEAISTQQLEIINLRRSAHRFERDGKPVAALLLRNSAYMLEMEVMFHDISEELKKGEKQ